MQLPVALNVQGKRCLVVGGGRVAARKVNSLQECGAAVTVIAPTVCAELQAMKAGWKHEARAFRAGDCAGFDLVFACTDRRKVNAQVEAEARRERIWCNIADDAVGSDFHSTAVVRRGDICIGISTAAGSPALARHLRSEVESCVGVEYATLLELVAARRGKTEQLPGEQTARAALWRAILQSDVLRLLREGHRVAAEDLIDTLIAGTIETQSGAPDSVVNDT